MADHLKRFLSGDCAPDFTATGLSGETITLSSYRGQKCVVLIFLRYIGCPLCRRYMARLAEQYSEFEEADAELIVFVQSSQEDIKKHSPMKRYPFRIIPDPDATIYEKYGVGRVAPLTMLNPSVAAALVKALAGGHSHGLLLGDELRAPGAFIVDKNGSLRLARAGSTVADIPPSAEILNSVKE